MSYTMLSAIFVYILVSQYLLAFFILIRLDKGLCGHDIRLLFLSVMALYSLFWPLVSLAFQFPVITDVAFSYTLICYNLALFAFNLVLVIKRRPWRGRGIARQHKGRFALSILFFVILVFFSMFYMYSRGVPIFSFGEGMLARKEYFENVEQSWVVLSFTISGVCCFLIYYFSQLTKIQKVFLLSFITLYFIYQISLGNRNEIVVIVFFSICCILVRRNKSLNIKLLLVFFLLFVFSFYITLIRDSSTRDAEGSEATELAIQSNEFMYPMQTTYYTIRDNWELRYGETYFILPIQMMIPRILYKEKPASLGTEFIEKTFGKGWFGYAYTPVTEAYLNFGYLGPFMVFFLFSLFLDHLIKNANKKGVNFRPIAQIAG